MILTEIFMFLKWSGVIDVSWWWIVYFVLTDWGIWASIRRIFK